VSEPTAWQNFEPIIATAGDEFLAAVKDAGKDNLPIELLVQLANISQAISLKRIADALTNPEISQALTSQISEIAYRAGQSFTYGKRTG
jgi:hypothetical protein